jgi:hypothetical protein
LNINAEAAILNVCSANTLNIHSGLVRFNDKSRFGAQVTLKRQTAAEIGVKV